ncbi:hypothetical protein [Leptospira sp. GIMC2001]|uniref:hypothetical protein n=1 Tax=Leptospira sp. GIMC2001 TaxID=1513297 RepID=UPI00234BEBB8|nr:hypothetical protein [Leptospira sp. GIMC2001]WCL47753.1 hypothetical protein O4O04_00415 [Leptospira sp. GIMC2001]
MKFLNLWKFVLIIWIYLSYFNLSAQSGKLLVVTSNSDQKMDVLAITSDSQTILPFPEKFKSQGLAFPNRIEISKKRILAVVNPLLDLKRKLLIYEWESGLLSELNYPQDTGIKVFRGMLAFLDEFNLPIFGELHQSGDQRLFRLNEDKQVFYPHIDTYRKAAAQIDDFLSTGEHIFRIFIKDKSVKGLEDIMASAQEGFSQKLFYCSSLNCKPEEIASDKVITSARIVNQGKHIIFLTYVSRTKDKKRYNLESYDRTHKKRSVLFSFETGIKSPDGYFNRGNPTFRVLNNSSLVFFTKELSNDEDSIQNWKLVNVESGLVEDFKLPEGYKWAPMLPVSYHKSTNASDVTTLDPFLVFIKSNYDRKNGWQSQLKVIQFPEKKTVLDIDMKSVNVLNAAYVEGISFP